MTEKFLQLQPRLRLLAELVPDGARLVDVGTDHGYLPVWLIQQKRIAEAIASDVGQEPLQHAQRTAQEYDVAGVDFRLCDGLQDISPEEVDTVVIAGMGGQTIMHILEEAPWTKNGSLLLLQPMTKPELLRVWLTENGYTIERERLVWDKDYIYPVFLVRGGVREELTLAEEYGGIGLEDDPLFKAHLDQRIHSLTRAIEGLRRAEHGGNQKKQQQLEEIRAALLEKRGMLR